MDVHSSSFNEQPLNARHDKACASEQMKEKEEVDRY